MLSIARSRWPSTLLAVPFAAMLGSLLASCDMNTNRVPTLPASSGAALNRALLTGEAARSLDAAGRFILPPPRDTQFPIISEADARERAEAWVRIYGAMNRPFLEEKHGGPIDFGAVRVCPRIYFAYSPFGDLPAELDVVERSYMGPHWMVSLCAPDGTPQFSLAIAAYSTHLRVEDGQIVRPFYSGSEHFWYGIPRGAEFPISPERAAQVASELTGRRVAGVPELVLDGTKAPQYARWRVPMNAPVRLRSARSSVVVVTSDLFVGSADLDANVVLSVPDPAAPRIHMLRKPVRDSDWRRIGTKLVPVPLRPGQPNGFEKASPIAEGR